MSQFRTPILLTGIIVLAIGALTGLTWLNLQLGARGDLGQDFLPRWEGTRLFVVEGQSPYGNASSVEIQRLLYGRRARPGEDPGYFLYPLYSILVFLPFAAFKDFVLARALWMTVLEVALIGLFVVSLNLSRWRISSWMYVVLVLFSAFWYHTIHPVTQGNASVLVALFLMLGFLAVRSENDVIAGLMFVLATIKPQMVVLTLFFVLAWAISHGRWVLFWSFTGSLALLVAAMTLLLPDWLVQNGKQILLYADAVRAGTPGAVFSRWFPALGPYLSAILTAILVVILLWEWRLAMGKEFRWFLWTAYLTLAVSPLIGIRSSVDNFIVLLPGLILVLATWDERWGVAGRIMITISVIALQLGLWALVFRGDAGALPPDVNPRIFFFVPLYLLFGLFFVRWWAIRPPRLPMEEFVAKAG